MARLSGRSAIVTGAAQGIGAAYAIALAAEGAKVSLWDIKDAEAVAATILAAGGEAIACRCDVSDAKVVADLVNETDKIFGGVHILVNNAAVLGSIALRPFYELNSAEWDQVMAVNVRGTFECIRAALPVMRRQKYGKIINIASGVVFKGTPMMAHYVASKGAVVAMTRSMAREIGEFGICCNCLAPGLTSSETVRSQAQWSAAIAANIESRCFKREEQPEDLIGALLFLASADSDFVTGQTIVVDGGSAMH